MAGKIPAHTESENWNPIVKAQRTVYCYVLLTLLMLAGSFSYGEVFQERKFDNEEQAERYRALIAELRCLVCQNQNIADSNADLAKDLRDKVYELITQGQSDADIADFMVNRYGDFVLYRPPLKASTVVLWVAPFIVMIFSLGMLVRYIRIHRRSQKVRPTLSEEQRRQAAELLGPPEN